MEGVRGLMFWNSRLNLSLQCQHPIGAPTSAFQIIFFFKKREINVGGKIMERNVGRSLLNNHDGYVSTMLHTDHGNMNINKT